MRNVRVTARLAAPLAGHAPMLDSLCESVMRSKMSAVLRTPNGHRHSREGRDLVPIPVRRKRLGSWLIPCASSPILPECAEHVEHYAKRTEVAEPELLAPKRRTQINTTGGEFKSYRLPLRCYQVDCVVWFAVAIPAKGKTGGAMSHLRTILRRVHAIGAKASMGYGQVAEWVVEPADDDWSWFAPADAGPVLMRPLPIGPWLPDDLVGYRQWYDAPCGPYWDAANYTEVVQPC